MQIGFEKEKDEQAANDHAQLVKYVKKQKAHFTADDLQIVLDDLEAADSLFDLPKTLYKPHPLRGKYKSCFSVWISKKDKRFRVIFRPDHDDDSEFRIDNPKTIKRIIVVELCKDYHSS